MAFRYTTLSESSYSPHSQDSNLELEAPSDVNLGVLATVKPAGKEESKEQRSPSPSTNKTHPLRGVSSNQTDTIGHTLYDGVPKAVPHTPMNQQGKLHSVLQRVSRRHARRPLQQHNTSTRERRDQRDTQLRSVTSFSSLQTDRSRFLYSKQLSLSLSDSLEGEYSPPEHFKDQNGAHCQTQHDGAVGNVSEGCEVINSHKQLPFTEDCKPSHKGPVTS